MHALKSLLIASLLLPYLLNAQNQNKPKTLGGFLSLGAAEIKQEYMVHSLGYFINNDYYKNGKKFTWLKGSLKASTGEEYQDLDLKFNTINNTVYLKKDETIYRISSTKISTFTLIDDGESRLFHKGFVVSRSTGFTVFHSLKTSEFLRYLMAHSHFDQFEISKMSFGTRGSSNTISIDIKGSSPSEIYNLRNYLERHELVEEIKISGVSGDISQNTFFEVLFDQKEFRLLKRNYKKISNNEAVALAKNSITHVFDEENYYFANANAEIRRFLFNKKSIQKGLSFAGITDLDNLPALRNEKKLLGWLNQRFQP